MKDSTRAWRYQVTHNKLDIASVCWATLLSSILDDPCHLIRRSQLQIPYASNICLIKGTLMAIPYRRSLTCSAINHFYMLHMSYFYILDAYGVNCPAVKLRIDFYPVINEQASANYSTKTLTRWRYSQSCVGGSIESMTQRWEGLLSLGQSLGRPRMWMMMASY